MQSSETRTLDSSTVTDTAQTPDYSASPKRCSRMPVAATRRPASPSPPSEAARGELGGKVVEDELPLLRFERVEVVDRRDQPVAAQVLPDAVHDVGREVRVLGRHDPVGQDGTGRFPRREPRRRSLQELRVVLLVAVRRRDLRRGGSGSAVHACRNSPSRGSREPRPHSGFCLLSSLCLCVSVVRTPTLTGSLTSRPVDRAAPNSPRRPCGRRTPFARPLRGSVRTSTTSGTPRAPDRGAPSPAR